MAKGKSFHIEAPCSRVVSQNEGNSVLFFLIFYLLLALLFLSYWFFACLGFVCICLKTERGRRGGSGRPLIFTILCVLFRVFCCCFSFFRLGLSGLVHSPAWPHYGNPSASAYRELGFQAWATTLSHVG